MLAFAIWALFVGGGKTSPVVFTAAVGASFFSSAVICNVVIYTAFEASDWFRSVLFHFEQHIQYPILTSAGNSVLEKMD